MYSIGDLSRQTGVKIPTIRYYEQMGLIDALQRTEGNQRRYSKHELKRLSFIKHSRDLGFAIEDIRELLKLSEHREQPCGNAHDIAIRHLTDTKVKIKKLKKLERELNRISTCDSKTVGECAVIETLADHRFCQSDH